MRKYVSLFLVALLGFSMSVNRAYAEDTSLSEEELASLALPIVQSYDVENAEKVWTMTENTRFIIPHTDEYVNNERLKEVVELAAAEFLEKGLPTATEVEKIYADRSVATSNDIVVTLSEDGVVTPKSDSDEAYEIIMNDDGVEIVAASENAVLHAFHTIQQLMIANEHELVYGKITDFPDLDERRVHVDMARKYITKDWFIQHIRELSYLKMNTIQLHFNENMGFRIESETDPEIVSDEYLTKDEIREIIAEARKYGINVIPSLDTPGHTEHILKVHPEFGQVNVDGEHSDVAFDVTNPDAIEYLKDLYTEYMELFEGSTDFHIGADEYMEFDREPFTTEYKPVLNEYAEETLGKGHTWKDVMATFINDIAEHVYEGGFTPRIWNDGIYYGETEKNAWEPDEPKQQVEMHDYIGIDFWSQMAWNKSIATLQTFIDRGHTDIYNINASFFYYVLRNDKPDDGREQHSFDFLNQDERIYNEWSPGKFQENTVDDDADYIRGASLAIWNDNPNLVGEDVITEDIANELRALATKSWNSSSSEIAMFEEFKANADQLGNAAAFEKGSQLPEVSNISVYEENIVDKSELEAIVSEVKSLNETDYTSSSWEALEAVFADAKSTLVDENATQDEVNDAVAALETVLEGLEDAEEPTPTPKPEKVDKTKLEAAIAELNELVASNYTKESWNALEIALTEAHTVLADTEATQTEVDETLTKLEKALSGLEEIEETPATPEESEADNGDNDNEIVNEDSEEKEEGSTLPKTATNTMNILLIGSAILFIGFAGLFVVRRKKA